ncbi:MAG TPA: hypothetical protein VFD39_13615, partial [Trueperaceae bacterium]|nr:hypothetical protein [Trueperaceae bacterium]
LLHHRQRLLGSRGRRRQLVEHDGSKLVGGGELFTTSTARDVIDFIEYMLASDSRNARFVFVDAYAQWALDGAPPVE